MIAEGGYQGTGLVIPHRRPAGGELCEWKQEHNRSRKQVRIVRRAFGALARLQDRLRDSL